MTSGIHRWPHTSHTATLASVHPIAPDYSYLTLGQIRFSFRLDLFIISPKVIIPLPQI